jgi:hypothetical protein
MRSLSVYLLATIGVATLAAQTAPIRPGRYAVTMQLEMANMPAKMPEMKSEQCITPEDVKRDPQSWLPNSGDPKRKDDCKMTDYKVDGHRVSWKMACTTPQAMSGSGDIEVKGDTYTGVMKMSSPQGEMTMKMAASRVGDCTK